MHLPPDRRAVRVQHLKDRGEGCDGVAPELGSRAVHAAAFDPDVVVGESARHACNSPPLAAAVRAVLADARAHIAVDPVALPSIADLLATAEHRLADRARETLFPVINATGVVIHTNLGRAPLAPEAVAAAQAACCNNPACAAFSYATDGSGSGYYKGNAQCGVVKAQGYDGYAKPSQVPSGNNATAADIAGLSTAQAAALTHPEWLLPAAAAGFSAAQVAALTAGWGAVSAAWLNALSPAAFAAIPTKNIALFAKAALDGLSAKQIAGMSTAQVAAIAHADWLGITAYAGFSAAQVAAITTSWSYMSAAQINALSTTAIAGLSATAIGNISASAFAGIDAAHLKALSATQAAAITSAQTGALTAAQIAALSTGQIAAMTNLAGLTATAAAALSAAQVAAITNGWGSFSAAQIAALSPAALAAASAANLAKLTTSATAGSNGITAPTP